MPFTTAFNNDILNHLFGKVELIPFIFEAAILLRDEGEGIFYEPNDENYKRILIPTCNWAKESPGVIVNKETIFFNKFLRDTLVSGIGLYEHPNHDTLYIFSVTIPGKFYTKGTHVVIYPGNLKIRFK